MKKTRFLSALLAVLMLLGSVALLGSCGSEDGAVKIGHKTLEMDLSGFAVYYGEELASNEVVCGMADELALLVSEITGKRTGAVAFNKAPAAQGGLEILIGQSSREETQKALKSIKGDGFAIRVTESKIVIVGTTKILTVQALEYFLQNYLRAAQPGKIELPAKITASKVQSVMLASEVM